MVQSSYWQYIFMVATAKYNPIYFFLFITKTLLNIPHKDIPDLRCLLCYLRRHLHDRELLGLEIIGK